MDRLTWRYFILFSVLSTGGGGHGGHSAGPEEIIKVVKVHGGGGHGGGGYGGGGYGGGGYGGGGHGKKSRMKLSRYRFFLLCSLIRGLTKLIFHCLYYQNG